MKHSETTKQIGLILSSAIMLTLIHAPFDMSFFAPVAYVPLVIGFIRAENKKKFVLITYTVWVVYWLFNLNWLINIIAAGWFAIGLVMALFNMLFLYGLSICIKRKYPLWISVAVLITGVEWLYGIPFGGFKWHLLGHSLYKDLVFIQIADIFGVAAISFVIAMVNGILCDIITVKNIRKCAVGIAATAAVVVATTGYGLYRLSNMPQKFEKGPLIAVVQTNIPSIVKEDKFEGEKILETLLELSKEALESGAELVVWPETIVSSSINKDFLAYSPFDSEPWWYHRQLSDFTRENETYLITGATSLKVGEVGGKLEITDQFNSAFMYKPDGRQWDRRYDKIHLVPFGEYIPPKQIEWIRSFFISFSPWDYDYTLTPGSEYVRFHANLEGTDWNFGTMICYEDTDAVLNRKLVYNREKGKVDWLLNISNDGWYVWYRDGEVKPSIELPQRTAISVFRAIENRVTVLRSVNAGISCVIEPTGRIAKGYQAGTLPKKPFDRQAVEGWLAARPYIYPRVAVFTRIGTVFSNVCGLLLMVLIASHWIQKKRRKAH